MTAIARTRNDAARAGVRGGALREDDRAECSAEKRAREFPQGVVDITPRAARRGATSIVVTSLSAAGRLALLRLSASQVDWFGTISAVHRHVGRAGNFDVYCRDLALRGASFVEWFRARGNDTRDDGIVASRHC